jgi:hypothetical protein
MPHFTAGFSLGAPIVDLILGVSEARLNALQAAGLPWPTPRSIRGLVDTGASHTCVDPAVLTALQLSPTGSVPVLTPSTGSIPIDADTYDVSLIIPNLGQAGLIMKNMQVTATDLLAAQGFHALVGRDVLSHCILICNGSQSTFSIAY